MLGVQQVPRQLENTGNITVAQNAWWQIAVLWSSDTEFTLSLSMA